MQTFYKNHRIVTERKGKSTNFEVFAPTQFGGRCEAAGFVMDEWSQEIDMAAERGKDLVDASFETPILREIRKLSKY